MSQETTKVNPQLCDNIANENLQKLAQLFPAAVKDGALDLDALREELGEFEELQPGDERYELSWAGKQAAKKKVFEPLQGKTLKFVPEGTLNEAGRDIGSKHADTTGNLFIEGDNLEALKLLRQNYYGAIKMIYIDPPYNTGNDFVYTDKFSIGKEESDQAEGAVSDSGERLVKNEKSSNRYHARWLDMIYPRLKLAKDLLRENGVIFISIDDNEVASLRKVCDEVFGEENFLGAILWKKKTNGNNMGYIPPVHDYFICYAKCASDDCLLGFLIDEEYINSNYKNPDNDPLGPWTTSDLSANHKGPYFSIKNPSNGEEYFPSKGRYWVFNEKEVLKRINDGRIIFGKTGNSRPVQKKYLSERESNRKKAESWWEKRGMNEDGTGELAELFSPKIFDHSKPSITLKNLIEVTAEYDELVCDFFAGTSSTAHAVMQLNAEDGGNRKFIMVQIPELCNAKSEAAKAGYKTIAELSKERIRRSGEKIKTELVEKAKANESKQGALALEAEASNADNPYLTNPEVLDIGFKVFRIGETNINWLKQDLRGGELDYSDLTDKDRLDFVEGFSDLDVVYELVLRQAGIPLTELIQTLNEIGSRTYLYGNAYLVCLEESITEAMVEEMAKIEPTPLKFFFRDSAFGKDIALKDETFRRLSAEIHKNASEQPTYTVEFI